MIKGFDFRISSGHEERCQGHPCLFLVCLGSVLNALILAITPYLLYITPNSSRLVNIKVSWDKKKKKKTFGSFVHHISRE